MQRKDVAEMVGDVLVMSQKSEKFGHSKAASQPEVMRIQVNVKHSMCNKLL